MSCRLSSAGGQTDDGVYAGVVVTATLVVVVGGGALFRVLGHREYHTIWTGLWVRAADGDHGRLRRRRPEGRGRQDRASLIMLEGIAFLAIVTAGITSTFVARAARERLATAEEAETDDASRIDARFDDLAEQLNRVESTLDRLAGPSPDRPSE